MVGRSSTRLGVKSFGDPIVRLRSLLASIHDDVERHGFGPAMSAFSMWAINHIVPFKIFRGFQIDTPDPTYLRTEAKYRCGFLGEADLARLCRSEEYELPEEFLQQAFAKGDECFGVLDGDILASYGWYSRRDTDVSEDLTLHFDCRYIYAYKGFTHPDYRGRRLLATGMTMALVHYLNRGFAGLVGYVESNNLNSLKSVLRMGYREFGRMYVVKTFNRYWMHATPSCRDYGFGLAQRR